jgi:hypothetical protein
LRLLFVAVAVILRNVWVWLHAEVMAQPQRGARHLRPQSLRFARLLLWLLMEVATRWCPGIIATGLTGVVRPYEVLYDKMYTTKGGLHGTT